MMDPLNDGLSLDAETHRYTFGGVYVGGVTEILTALGIIDPRWFDAFSRDRGTAVHYALRLLAEGRLDWSTVDERIRGYVRAGEKFLMDAGFEIGSGLTEHLVYHPAHRYAGRLDLSGVMFGSPAVVDWKSGGLGFAGIATAAYEDALRQELGERKPFRRIAVQLRDDGSYKKTDYTKASDYNHWFAACLVFNNYILNQRKERDHE